MFTGIVEELGVVQERSARTLRIAAEKVLAGTKLGDSISVSGACLTVTEMGAKWFAVEIMPETISRTNIGRQARGDRVNLERALTLSSRIGGHLVQGHVDSTGEVRSLTPQGNSILARIAAPPGVSRYLVEKGFVAVDGISLTVVSCTEGEFVVSLVGFTVANTTLGVAGVGRTVNLEVDIVAKYVEHFTKNRGSGLTMELLTAHGYNAAVGHHDERAGNRL